MNKYYINKLLIGASVLAIHFGTLSSDTSAQTCPGTAQVDCLDHKGRVITPASAGYTTYCATNPVASSRPSDICDTATCPPPPPPRGGDGGGDGDRGFDVDGDGTSDYGSYSEARDAVEAAGGDVSAGGDISEVGCSGSCDSSHGEIGGGDGDGGGDGCFVTTAVVDIVGEADNGPILTKLRHLRDYYTAHHHRGAERIRIYYEIAPRIVQTINNLNDSEDVWLSVHQKWIDPITELINTGNYRKADNLYADMVLSLSWKYLAKSLNPKQRKNLFLHAFKIHKI